MAGKSLEEIWEKLQKENSDKKLAEQLEIDKINEARELQRKEWLKRMKMYESVSNASSTAAGAGGGTITLEWINGYAGTPYNTAWIYPQSDLDIAVSNINSNNLLGPGALGFTYSEVNFTKVDNYNYTFPTLEDVINFYIEMFTQTAVTQPSGNSGFSLGVGTILRSRRNPKLKFKLDSGVTIVEFLLMTQITSQSTLPVGVGANSPDGTVGWGPVYLDWNADGVADLPTDPIPNNYVDPLRFKLNN
jgi:hypothetical protein